MKVLIVDDEAHVRETIRILLPWERFDALQVFEVLEATNGEEAIRIIERENPQIVFTDIMMPGMDGIELLKWIHAQAETTKVIIISGYNDFQYARQALKYGGFDYILKPLDEDELAETFYKAVEAWQLDDRERLHKQEVHRKVNQWKPMLADTLFRELLRDPDENSTTIRLLREEFAVEEHTECRVAIVCLDLLDLPVRTRFDESPDLLQFAVANICNEYLRQADAGIAFHNWNQINEIVLLFFRQLGQMPEALQDIGKGLHDALHGHFYIGYGSVHAFPREVNRAYSEARLAFKQREKLEGAPYLIEYIDSRHNHLLFEIESYIQTHYCSDLQLQTLAEQFFISPSHLSRSFKQQFGENISDYITRLRIQRAKSLLADPNLKIAAVAKEVGYSDEKYFSKAFKRAEGLSPKDYRKTLVI